MYYLEDIDVSPGLIQQAEEGDTDIARQLVGALADRLRDNRPLPDHIRNYLAVALSEIAKGGDANKAFHLAKRRGRASYANDERNANIRQWVDLCRIALDLTLEANNQTKESAFVKAARRYHLSPEAVKKIYYRRTNPKKVKVNK